MKIKHKKYYLNRTDLKIKNISYTKTREQYYYYAYKVCLFSCQNAYKLLLLYRKFVL